MKKILLLSSLLCFQFAQSQIQLISDVSGVITLKNESAEINFVSVQNDLVLPVIESGKPMLRKGTPDLPRTASAVIVDDTFMNNIALKLKFEIIDPLLNII